MWINETNKVIDVYADKQQIKQEYSKIVKKARKQADSNIYLYIQVFFMSVIIVTSVMLKNADKITFDFAKENYSHFFETDTYMESTFSYNSFINNMKNELQIRFGQLITVFNELGGKGSADIYPDNVSTKKIFVNEKGVTPAIGYISSPYGVRINPFNNKEKEFHTGMDIATAKGTFIKAAFSGIVSAAGTSSVAGNYIRIKSDNGISTMYAHNQFNLVKEGEKIMAGQVLATIGETGMATGPHLHFEFIVNGVRYNPVYALNI